MNCIIPYKEGLYKGDGGFIKPNGGIILTDGAHEKFARNFCNGHDYERLMDLRSKGYSEEHERYKEESFQEYVKLYNLNWKSRKDIDVYHSTKLTREQLKLYKLWLEEYEFARRNLFSDFLVYLLSFDKVETIMRKTITTISPCPHVRFFNYYLMDWNIDEQTPMRYDDKTEQFEYDEDNEWGNYYKEDREAEHEIHEIKAKVLRKDRTLFFR